MARTRKPALPPTRRSERVQVAKALTKSKEEASAKVTKPKRFRRPKQRKNCRLLALPGEIRNRIYRCALVQETITVTSTGPGQPSLLRVCRALRREAASIYYGENDFSLRVMSYNGAIFLPFARQFMYHHYPGWHKRVSFRLMGLPNWDNLMEWMKLHETHWYTLYPETEDPVLRDDFVMSGASRIMEAMKYLRWDSKKEALDAFYTGLRGTCSRWVKAEDMVPH